MTSGTTPTLTNLTTRRKKMKSRRWTRESRSFSPLKFARTPRPSRSNPYSTSSSWSSSTSTRHCCRRSRCGPWSEELESLTAETHPPTPTTRPPPTPTLRRAGGAAVKAAPQPPSPGRSARTPGRRRATPWSSSGDAARIAGACASTTTYSRSSATSSAFACRCPTPVGRPNGSRRRWSRCW